MSASGLFRLESEQNTLIITPLLDMGEFNVDQIKEEGNALVLQIAGRSEANIVIDFGQSSYFGSDALGLFMQLWKKASQRGGRIAFCDIRDPGGEILRRAKFDHLGPICATRSEALAALRS